MNNTKFVGILHILAQVLAQGAILTLIPAEYQPYLQAAAVVIGLIISYLDPTSTIEKLGLSKQQYLGKVVDVKLGKIQSA